jgi:CheY-like chemotaxis protein
MDNQPQRVLLADDSKFLRAAHELFLKKDGFAVIKASDGEEALALARRERPDVVVLDLLMPKLSGTEVLKALKEDPGTANIPVIILSGLAQKSDDTLSASGAAAYVEKSKYGPEALPQFVRRVLQERQT